MKTRTKSRFALVAIAGVSALLLQSFGVAANAAEDPVDGLTVAITDTTPRTDGTIPFETTGTWSASSSHGPGGEASLYSITIGSTATWRPVVAEAGTYHIEAGLPGSTNSAKTSYQVEVGSTTSTVRIDQQEHQASWTSLGVYHFDAGETAEITLTVDETRSARNTRVSSLRLVAFDEGTPIPLPYVEDFTDGTAGWTAITGSLDAWNAHDEEFPYISVDTTTESSGFYVRPDGNLNLPDAYVLNTSVKIGGSGSGTVSILTDLLPPFSHVADNLATQFNGGIMMARPNSKFTVCSGDAPYLIGEWFQLKIVRADDVTAVYVDDILVAAVVSPAVGGSIGLGVYHGMASFGPIGVTPLDSTPAGHPASADGCVWTPPGADLSGQAVITNQTGFNLGEPKRFTAPRAEDGDPFVIKDAEGDIRYSGVVEGQVGDLTAFDPEDTGPFTIVVTGEAGEGESFPFGIGANWIERVSYEPAVNFMTDVRCFWGDMTQMVYGGTRGCYNGVGWRDSHQLSFEVPSMIDLYLANPSVFQSITDPEAPYIGMKYPLPTDTPEIVRSIAWGVETYLKGEVNHTLLKEQLAAFLYAYPQLSAYLPVGLYNEARDYLFPIWGDAEKDRFAWYEYTAHTADLFQTYTQIGTGKGEFPVGHSVGPNVQMYEVALREGRDDAQDYLDAAVNQAAWIIDNIDVTDPLVTKGQRQGEYHLITGLAKLQMMAPDAAPSGLTAFVQDWADTVLDRSDNLWDFHKYSDDRWTIPSFSGGGSGSDPNETGNILGFPAAALAAVHVLGEGATSDRLREIAVAQVDGVFGRNPVSRAATYRATSDEYGFEGLEVGWFSEFQGGAGELQGSRGVFDGSPKNAHYPFNPQVGNPGHSEGWVTFNTAWNESLAWRAFDTTSLSADVSDPQEGSVVPVTLRAPLNMDAAGGNTAEVLVSVNDAPPTSVIVSQTAPNALDYRTSLDLSAIGALEGDTVEISYGLGQFTRSTSFTVTAEGSGPVDPDPSASLSVSTVAAGGQVTVIGAGFDPGESIAVVLQSDPVLLGNVVADGSGAFTRTFTVPAGTTPGAHSLVLNGEASGSVELALTVIAPAATPGTDLAFTGAAVGELLLRALAILGSGVVIVALRRRRVTHHR